MFRCKTMPDNGFFGLDKVKNKLYYVRAGKGRTLSSLGVCISHINSMQWIRRRSKILRKMLMHISVKNCVDMGLGAGGRGQFLFERNPSDISYKRSFDEKKGQILATWQWISRCYLELKKIVNDYIRGSYFLYLYFFWLLSFQMHLSLDLRLHLTAFEMDSLHIL